LFVKQRLNRQPGAGRLVRLEVTLEARRCLEGEPLYPGVLASSTFRSRSDTSPLTLDGPWRAG
jgi:hypothetical protein